MSTELFIEEYLISKGCKSLGEALFEAAKKMLITSLVLSLLKDNTATEEVESAIEKAEKWMAMMEDAYPMLPYQ